MKLLKLKKYEKTIYINSELLNNITIDQSINVYDLSEKNKIVRLYFKNPESSYEIVVRKKIPDLYLENSIITILSLINNSQFSIIDVNEHFQILLKEHFEKENQDQDEEI